MPKIIAITSIMIIIKTIELTKNIPTGDQVSIIKLNTYRHAMIVKIRQYHIRIMLFVVFSLFLFSAIFVPVPSYIDKRDIRSSISEFASFPDSVSSNFNSDPMTL